MRPIFKTALAIAAGSMLCLPTPATAATVGVSGSTLSFDSAPGESNDVTVSVAGPSVVVTDVVALTPLAGCSSISASEALCSLDGVTDLRASMGDGDDAFSMKGIALPAWLDAGTGTDHLHGGALSDALLAGGAGRDNLNGDGGADTLLGSDGDDSLNGGPGEDRLVGGGGADILKGGGENDTADYSARPDPISADPDAVADDGAAGEGDNIATDVEVIAGGTGPDRLTAAVSTPTKLIGGPGSDVLTGRDAADVIVSRDHGRDQVACGGSFADTVTADFSDAIATDCETVGRAAAEETAPAPEDGAAPPATDGTSPTGSPATVAPVSITAPATVTLRANGALPVGVRCAVGSGRCTGTIEIVEAGGQVSARAEIEPAPRRKTAQRLVIGRREFSLGAGTRKNIVVRLSRRGRQRIIKRGRRRTRAKIVVTTTAADGSKVTSVKSVSIRAPAERRTSARSRSRNRG